MKIKYTGTKTRTNSFGTFEPDKEYEVTEEIGNKLLSIPILFKKIAEPEKAPQPQIEKAPQPEQKRKKKKSRR